MIIAPRLPLSEDPLTTTIAVLEAVMLVYFLIDNHVPLWPWNHLQGVLTDWVSTVSGWVPGLFVLWSLCGGPPWALVVSTVWSWIWLLLQLNQWWRPYLFGRGPGAPDFDWYWTHGYAGTLKWLPVAAGRRPTPDAQHNVLQLLSLMIAVGLTIATARVLAA